MNETHNFKPTSIKTEIYNVVIVCIVLYGDNEKEQRQIGRFQENLYN